MARPASVLAMTGAGFGGAMLYDKRDLLDDFMNHGTRGLIHSMTRPSSTQAASTNGEVQSMMEGLSNQIDHLNRAQRNSHEIIVSTNQPSSLMGVPVWQLVGAASTLGAVYMKVKGYELRDLVYVSKKHFDSVTDTLRQQFDVLEESVNLVRTDLLEKIGIVESKVDEARESINETIAVEVGKVDTKVGDISEELEKLGGSLEANNKNMDIVASDVASVKSDLASLGQGIDSQFSNMESKVANMQSTTTETHKEMRSKMTNISGKIETLQTTTDDKLSRMQANLEKQSKGIGLLCEFVCESKPSVSASSMRLMDELQTFAKSERVGNDDVSRSKSVPLLRKRQSEGLAGMKPPQLLTN